MASERDSAGGAEKDEFGPLKAGLEDAKGQLQAGDSVAAERAAKALSAIVRAARDIEDWRAVKAPAAFEEEAWEKVAHPAQLAPQSRWSVWVFLGGRGAGKTRAGAEWVRAQAFSGKKRRIALIAPTFHEAREVLVEGPSGLRRLSGPAPAFEPSRKRLVWPNGAEGYVFSAEDPDSLRGPQFDAAWADELCAYAYPEETLAVLRLGLRLGRDPRLVVTTTPAPIPALKALLAQEGTVATNAPTAANRANLAPGFVEQMEALWAGTLYGRQELDGVLVEDLPDALWRREIIARANPEDAVAAEIVVGVDPPASDGERADSCGIVAVGATGEGRARRAFVLADATLQGVAPERWAEAAAALAKSVRAQRIVAEANNGGAMVRSVLAAAGADVPVRLVYAHAGKRARAAPIAALYAQKRVLHAGLFKELEDQMCAFGAAGSKKSPDRVDALVWALTDLMIARATPRLRSL